MNRSAARRVRLLPTLNHQILKTAFLAGLAIVLGGCDSPPGRFRIDRVYLRKWEKEMGVPFTTEQLQNLADIGVALFGTPDESQRVSDPEIGVQEVVDIENLELAAGSVQRDQDGTSMGLYRRHCAFCHGVSGSGTGPAAALLNPYPRDFRRGTFKFKSTPSGAKPTDEDLKRILINGMPGTACPSFRRLASHEIDALVDYVKYLSIRGEVERGLILEMSDLDEGELLLDLSKRTETGYPRAEDRPDSRGAERSEKGTGPLTVEWEIVKQTVADVVSKWKQVNSQVTPVSPRPSWETEQQKQDSIARGHALFHGEVASCMKCHGDSASGDDETVYYDDWAKELEPDRPTLMAELVALGGLPPRNIRPRDLRLGEYRGGGRPVDLYWRLRNGIEGTVMPAVLMLPSDQGLSEEDVWHLIGYVQSLPGQQPTPKGIKHSIGHSAAEQNSQ